MMCVYLYNCLRRYDGACLLVLAHLIDGPPFALARGGTTGYLQLGAVLRNVP